MTELRLSVEIVEFDLTHVRVKVTVLGKRKADEADNPSKARAPQSTSSTLRMTLIELHIFLRALLEFKGPIDLTTPDLLKVRESGQTDKRDDEDLASSFLSDEPFFGGVEAAE